MLELLPRFIFPAYGSQRQPGCQRWYFGCWYWCLIGSAEVPTFSIYQRRQPLVCGSPLWTSMPPETPHCYMFCGPKLSCCGEFLLVFPPSQEQGNISLKISFGPVYNPTSCQNLSKSALGIMCLFSAKIMIGFLLYFCLFLFFCFSSALVLPKGASCLRKTLQEHLPKRGPVLLSCGINGNSREGPEASLPPQ